MDLGIKGRVALVAAASQGLGRAVAQELATEGVDLLLCARTAKPLLQAKTEIERSSGVNVVAVPTDVSDESAIRRLVAQGLEHFGHIDVLVTNAGGPPPGPFEAHDLGVWRDALRQNLESVLTLVQEVLPGMKERRWGRIVNITSIAVKQPVDNLIISNSVRAAVTGFARTLANEVASYGITVNNVLPGFTRTERLEQLAASLAGVDGVSREDIFKRWEGQIPMGRVGEPKEFGATVAFLASDRASYITGTSIAVDGGWIRALY